MKCPPVLATEKERLKALSEYGLSGNRPLPSLDPVVQIAARIGGDEFAILLPGISNQGQASEFARFAIARVAEPIVIDGHEVRVAASCGVAVAPAHAQEALELIGDADLALFKAKSIGRGQTFGRLEKPRLARPW